MKVKPFHVKNLQRARGSTTTLFHLEPFRASFFKVSTKGLVTIFRISGAALAKGIPRTINLV